MIINAIHSALGRGAGHYTPSGSWQLATGHYEPTTTTPEIIFPRQAQTSSAYVYNKAHPNVPWRLPVGMLWGEWPFKVELSGAPSGMTIGQYYSDGALYQIMEWSSTSKTPGTYNFSVIFTTQAGNQYSSDVSLEVTTTGFIFVDEANGGASVANGGSATGVFDDPFVSMNDWYAGATGGTGSGTVADSTYADYTVIYRTGTYAVTDCYVTAASPGYTLYMNNGGQKPFNHMAYPGESVELDTSGAQMQWIDTQQGLICFSGITFPGTTINSRYRNIQIASGHNDILFFECDFGTGVGVGGANPACIMISAGTYQSSYVGFIGGTYAPGTDVNAIELYNTDKTLVENTTLTNSSGGSGWYFKESATGWCVRNCRGSSGDHIAVKYDNMNHFAPTYAELSWSYFNCPSSEGFEIGRTTLTSFGGTIGRVNCFRNTLVCTYNYLKGAADGDVTTTRNIIIQDGTYSGGWYVDNTIPYAGTFTATEDLVGISSDNIIDGSGNLIGAYLSTYAGIRGHIPV